MVFVNQLRKSIVMASLKQIRNSPIDTKHTNIGDINPHLCSLCYEYMIYCSFDLWFIRYVVLSISSRLYLVFNSWLVF